MKDRRRALMVLGGGGLAALLAVALLLFWGLWQVDKMGPFTPMSLWSRSEVVSTLSGFGEVTVAVLGVALTVIAILVQLAAYRYTPRITELFIRDPINMGTVGFFVVTTVFVLWVNLSLYGPVFPATMVLAEVGALSLAVLGLLPYFAYVFWFLAPRQVVGRIRQDATDAMERAVGGRPVRPLQQRFTASVEQLGDMALSAIKSDDKALAIQAMEGLAGVLDATLETKARLPLAWFRMAALVDADPDLVTLHPETIHALEQRGTWAEMKTLRAYLNVFGHAVEHQPDLNHLIAIHTRRFACRAAERKDRMAVEQAIRYFNSYLRESINTRGVRSAYYVLNEYRGLAEATLMAGMDEAVLEVAERLKFYGHVAFAASLGFLLETVAQDIGDLLEQAHQRSAPCHDALLALFLTVDRADGVNRVQEQSLRGVRVAQVKAAAYYLLADAPELAERVVDDLRSESPARLLAIRELIEGTVDPEWWEVSNRFRNFAFLAEDRRAMLPRLYGWLGLEGETTE